MEALLRESRAESASETLGDWERVLLGESAPWLGEAERRERLLRAGPEVLSAEGIKEAGKALGVAVSGVAMPFRPAFFGHARFGADRAVGPAGFSVLAIRARAGSGARREEFEARVRASVLASAILHFTYDEEAGDGGNVS